MYLTAIFLGTILGLMVGIPLGVATIDQMKFNEAQATGGAGELIPLVEPSLDRTIGYLQNNNTDLALEEITSLKNELDDTFSADKDEDEDD